MGVPFHSSSLHTDIEGHSFFTFYIGAEKMGKGKEDIIKETAEFWRKRTGEDFSSKDAKEMLNNISGFFQVLNAEF